MNDLNEYLIDLPHLNSIKLGEWALFGREDNFSHSLTVENDIDIRELISDINYLMSMISEGYIIGDCSLIMESDIDINELIFRSS